MKKISNVLTPRNPAIDLAIVKVNLPFQFTRTVQAVTLAPAGFVPPGIKTTSISNNCEFLKQIETICYKYLIHFVFHGICFSL